MRNPCARQKQSPICRNFLKIELKELIQWLFIECKLSYNWEMQNRVTKTRIFDREKEKREEERERDGEEEEEEGLATRILSKLFQIVIFTCNVTC